MENIGAPSPPLLRSFMTPFLLTILGITATCLIIVIYHFVVIKFCRSRQQETLVNNVLPLVNNGSSLLQIGVEKKILEKIPIIPYSLHKHIPQFHDDEAECVVCIGELEEGDMVRLLPSCKHTFHVSCIDQWFQEHASCPLCRNPINQPSKDHDSSLDEDEGDENNGNDNEVVGSSQDQDSHVEDSNDSSGASSSSSRVEVQRHRVLRHCVTLALPVERQSSKRGTMKRSLSLDHQACGIVIDIEKECHKDLCSSSSSSTKLSIKKLYCASSRLVRSLSLLRGPQTGGSMLLKGTTYDVQNINIERTDYI